MARVRPSDTQPLLPLDRIIVRDAPSDESIEVDVLFVGGGPAGLAGAIELAHLVEADAKAAGGLGEISIAVLEKSAALGEHSLSGSVVNPIAFRRLFPDLKDEDFPFRQPVKHEAVYLLTKNRSFRLPTPPTMRNHGNYTASLCEMVRWLGKKAEELGVDVFAGFPAEKLLVSGERVIGVRTAPSGLDRDGRQSSSYTPGTDVVARVTALAEGSRGTLAEAYIQWQEIKSENPQIYALGVKEIWETKKPLDTVIHTLGWPLPGDAFGGSFMYPLEPNVVGLGLVVGLDYRKTNLDTHGLLQEMKGHPLFRPYLEGGEMVEWGAKTIPEGGFYSLPDRRFGHGVVILGDSAGFVNVPSLKGIHYAMQSGIFAARTIFDALKKGETSAPYLASYDELVRDSFITDDIFRTRNMRLAFKSGFVLGGFKSVMMTLTGGRLFGKRIPIEADADVWKQARSPKALQPDGELTFSKVDAVFKSGNATRDTIPSHLITEGDVDREVAEMYASMCPAGVYELVDGKLRVNAPNCVDCKATDVLGPRWMPREGGSGPSYKRM
ncbi:MAG: 4Fe-4S dicluster domain-containing protein [Gemmatimonadetes bacterium]|nr:4Fe-4S dicluster domain-containing protein [Gemmatimonadota bacterium]